MILEPSKPENLQEALDAIKIENNPYFICVVDFSKDEKGTFLATIKGDEKDIYQMLAKLINSLPK